MSIETYLRANPIERLLTGIAYILECAYLPADSQAGDIDPLCPYLRDYNRTLWIVQNKEHTCTQKKVHCLRCLIEDRWVSLLDMRSDIAVWYHGEADCEFSYHPVDLVLLPLAIIAADDAIINMRHNDLNYGQETVTYDLETDYPWMSSQTWNNISPATRAYYCQRAINLLNWI